MYLGSGFNVVVLVDGVGIEATESEDGDGDDEPGLFASRRDCW